MSDSIRFTPNPGEMGGQLTEIPEFPAESYRANPEIIGDASQPCSQVTVDWTEPSPGVWTCNGQCAGELSYVLTLTPSYDSFGA